MIKIDKVLLAHGIGIINLAQPSLPTLEVNTDGLLGYWNSKSVNGETLINLAPDKQGQLSAFLYETTIEQDGIRFNGSTSHIQLPIPDELKTVTSATFEIRMRSFGGYADLINQEGRELLWIAPDKFELSGIFDVEKYRDNKAVYFNIPNKTLNLAIVADMSTGRVTTYIKDSAATSHYSDYYTPTIGTIASGNYIWISRSATPFQGYIDSIRMYDRALSVAELQQNWTADDRMSARILSAV